LYARRGTIAIMRLACGLVIVAVVATASHADVLVGGEPALTTDMVDRACDFLEWAIATPFTVEQREHAKDSLIAAWKVHDQGSIQAVTQMVALRDKLAAASAEQRAQVQPQVHDKIVGGLKNATDSWSKWLYGVYQAGHDPIAQGEPALTRQAIDAYAELIGFLYGEATSGKPITPDAQLRAKVAKAVANAWGPRSTPSSASRSRRWRPPGRQCACNGTRRPRRTARRSASNWLRECPRTPSQAGARPTTTSPGTSGCWSTSCSSKRSRRSIN